MPGPVTTLNNPLNVSGGGGTGAAGGSNAGGGISGDIDTVTGQVKEQTQQFGSLVKDPQFTGQSEMGSMLQLQRAISLEQMVYQTVSTTLKIRADNAKTAISNMK